MPITRAADQKYNKNIEALFRLAPEQYRVTRTDATKRPFANEYWDDKEPGLYVDVVSSEPLFASSDEFDIGAGWPSFTKPIEAANIVENKTDEEIRVVNAVAISMAGSFAIAAIAPNREMAADGNAT